MTDSEMTEMTASRFGTFSDKFCEVSVLTYKSSLKIIKSIDKKLSYR